jgi:glucosamine 6-phosphate synthetase-like amidotransferase/phosphosugar isomerase protein
MSTPALVPERNSHPYLTYDMIRDIPKGFRATLRMVSDFKVDPASEAIFTGNGTALYSAVMGSQVLALTPLDWRADGAFEIANYPRRRDSGRQHVTVGVSHSGITKWTMEALQREKSTGAKTIGITHFQDRPISKIADRTLVIGDSPDKSRCHTKAYTNSAVAVFALSLALAQPLSDELVGVKKDFETKLADEIESTISSSESAVKKAASELKDTSNILFA